MLVCILIRNPFSVQMLWMYLVVFKLTVLQNVIPTHAKLSPEDSPNLAEMLTNSLMLSSTSTPHLGFIFSNNELRNKSNMNAIQGKQKRKRIRNKGQRRGSNTASENKNQNAAQKRKNPTEVPHEIEYFVSALTSNNNKVQQSNKIKNNNSPEITTTTNNKNRTNTFSDKAKIVVTKSHAGMNMTVLPMRVENDLKRTTAANEVRRNQTEKYTTKTNNKRNSAANNNGGAVVVTSANTAQPSAKTKFYQTNTFVNPFGQLAAIFGNDQLHLQDYTFFFNAERHTVFQLHTNNFDDNNNNVNFSRLANHAESGRLLNAVYGSISLDANPMLANTTAYNSSQVRVEEVQLYNATSLRQSRYNPFNPTRILIHGWFGGLTAGVYQTLVPAYLRQGSGNYNVFTVDWGRGAVADYLTASYRVQPVGKVLAKFIDFLQREAGMRFEDLHLIGFSMGAHIAGIAGKHLESGRLRLIYALDPALPFFRYENFDDRIAITDADYVEVVHTSVGSYGYDQPLGHVDFYVNFGSAQPGCFFNECSHMRAYQIFAEALSNKQAFRAQGCDVKLWADMVKQRRCAMGTGRQMVLGGDPTNVTALRGRGGVFYLVTNASPPYAKQTT